MTKARDKRDLVTDRVQALVDHGSDEPDKRPAVAHLLFGAPLVGEPPGKWPPPTPTAREHAKISCAQAANAALTGLKNQGITVLYTTLRRLPEVRVEWRPLPPERVLPPAPLVHSLADAPARRVLTTLAADVFSRHTKELWDTDSHAKLMRRLNAFAQLELNLWDFAANGGHTAPPPYTVRYDLARWLWHPSIAGALFCLRCGSELRYRRGERTRRDEHRGADGPPRTARCRKCSRGLPHQWPQHAMEPYQQGTWLLRCTFPGCTDLFVGRRQARHCEHHRLNRLNPQLRPTNARPPA